jgi:hypothetical protein
MKLGQTGLFTESPEYVGRSKLGGGTPWAWGRIGATPRRSHHHGVEPKSKNPPLGWFGKKGGRVPT